MRVSPEFLGDRAFSRRFIEEFLQIPEPLILGSLSGEAKSIRSRLEKLEPLVRSPEREDCLLSLIKTAEVLYFLMRALRKKDSGSPAGANPAFSRLVPTLNFVQQNLHLKHSVPSLAHFSNFSTSRFAHLFIEVMGTSAGRYLMELRMKKAAQLLGTTSMTLERIAASVGVSSARVLSRQFNRFHSVTPRDYLRKGSRS